MAHQRTKNKIDRIEPTSENLTGRAGLTLWVRYLERINIYQLLDRYFGSIRKSSKGIGVAEAFKQLLCFFLDGTDLHLTHFDHLAADTGYAATIETDPGDMVSSHQMKRFLNGFSFCRNFLFRRLLQDLFLWRLQAQKPQVVLLDLDTMVMDNDDARCREGVDPTYKKHKGFQPLQLKWGPYVVDAVFRRGKKHSNHGKTVMRMMTHIVGKIRKGYDPNVPIVVTIDAGFFDQENFRVFEKLGIGYVCGGKLYSDIEQRAEQIPEEDWQPLDKEDGRCYLCASFGDRRGTWDKPRKAVFTRLIRKDHQGMFSFAQDRKVYYTNLGEGDPLDQKLKAIGKGDWLTTTGVVNLAHGRGRDELRHRALKEFGTEKLPFKRFEPNTAFYYTMILAFNLMEAFKRDVTKESISPDVYPTAFRRTFLDIAGKIVATGHRVILKVTRAVWERLNLQKIWDQANLPAVTALA
jgi:hypothetical protein